MLVWIFILRAVSSLFFVAPVCPVVLCRGFSGCSRVAPVAYRLSVGRSRAGTRRVAFWVQSPERTKKGGTEERKKDRSGKYRPCFAVFLICVSLDCVSLGIVFLFSFCILWLVFSRFS